MIQVGFKKLSKHAKLPTRAHATDSGFDLYSAEDVTLAPGETKVIKTDIAVVLPEGYEAQVRSRSGVTSKTKLRVQLGTIDNGYRGNIGIIVDNNDLGYSCDNSLLLVDGVSMKATETAYQIGTYQINKGDKIAQLVVQALPTVEAIEVTNLDDTDRNNNGFGSTGEF